MKPKKSVILLILMLLILTVSCVNAEDLNSTYSPLLSQDLTQSDMLGSSYCNNQTIESVTFQLPDDGEMLGSSYCNNQTLLASDANASAPLSSSPSVQNDKPEGIYGIVNFGSNVLGLKIYDVHNDVIINSLVMSDSSVISSYTQNNRLTQEGIEKLISQLEDYNEVMQSNGVTKSYIFATASLRNIDNSNEVVAAIKDRLDMDIDVISGEKEAEFGFKAVEEMDLTSDNGLLIDLGGGSCEITYFSNKTPVTEEYIPFGSNSGYKEYVSGTFPNETERLEIQNRTLKELNKLTINNTIPHDDLFGTGGTVYTIKLMLISLGFIDEDEMVIPVSMVGDLLDDIKDDTEENHQKILDVAPNRLYNFIPGIIIIKTILEYYNVKYLHFCNGQIEDGVLYMILENESSKDTPVDPSAKNESSNNGSAVLSTPIKQETVKVSSKLIANPTGNPIAMMVFALFLIVMSYRRD